MQRLLDGPSNYPARAGKLRGDQVADRGGWPELPEHRATNLAAAHVIRVVPAGSTTVTTLNPLDPGTVSSGETGDTYLGWLERPGAPGTVHRRGWPR